MKKELTPEQWAAINALPTTPPKGGNLDPRNWPELQPAEQDESREEARQRELEQLRITQNRRRCWAIAQDYARTLRDPVKKAFAFEYATFKFGTGNEKFRWNGKQITDWAEVCLQPDLPRETRKAVYKAIDKIAGW